jgi:DNA-binding NarL/FixJ family response regulator
LSPCRILIADDYSDWRRHTRLLFQSKPDWEVIAEARDGLEAVQKAGELKPDLIVLDIGLPKLNGIEAARRILQFAPNSKIVFLTQYNDLDIVQAALDTGALGYVHKANAQNELLKAVGAALEGKQFVDSNLKGYEPTGISGEKLRQSPRETSR